MLLLAAAPAAAKVTTYPLPDAKSLPTVIVSGPDDAGWFAKLHGDGIGRIDGAGHVTEVYMGGRSGAAGMTPTPWGTLAVANGGIEEVTPSGLVAYHALPDGLSPYGVALGSDSRIWFTADPYPQAYDGGAIGVLGADGDMTIYPVHGEPWGITRGGDGALWFAMDTETGGAIGRITTAGDITTFSLNYAMEPVAVALGGDGNVWFSDGGPRIGRITPAGAIEIIPIGSVWHTKILAIATNPYAGVVAADVDGHALWVVNRTDSTARKIPVGGKPGGVGLRQPDGMWFTLSDVGRVGWLSDDELRPACHVPAVVGRPLRRAKILLRDADCKRGGVVKRKHRGAKNLVLAQASKPGTILASGHGIALVVSR